MVSVVNEKPSDFVALQEYAPNVIIRLKYSTSNNFTGRPVKGYENRICWLTSAAADALKLVSSEAMSQGYILVVYDAYRSVTSVRDFQNWAADHTDDDDAETKRKYYPTYTKKALFEGGYIAGNSSHSRGSTVDVTLLRIVDRSQFDSQEIVER